MAPLAAAFHGHPSRRLSVVGVTGTNGKTTVTHLLASILRAAGRPVEVIGTLSGARTTPEAPVLQAQLAAVADGGGDTVAMEVSSHALDQHRVDATWFAVAVFTNLSRDHLDYHRTMERYFEAKARLFRAGRTRVAAIDVDDEHGRRLARIAEDEGITVRPVTQRLVDGYELRDGREVFSWRGRPVRLPLVGSHNVSNALAAAVAAEALGIGPAEVASGLSSAPAVAGRFERVDAGQPFTVAIDYAHTPAALEQTLVAARQIAHPAGGRVGVVFGCGGDRDRSKRPAMGAVAAGLADLVLVTSDNPRWEDPLEIIDDVCSGTPGLEVEADRRAAIARALDWARAGDVVVVAGKGHEAVQEVRGAIVPFDDRSVVTAELRIRQDRS